MELVRASAKNTDECLKDFYIPYADYIVSGLPFASIPQHVSDEILLIINKVLYIVKFLKKFCKSIFC